MNTRYIRIQSTFNDDVSEEIEARVFPEEVEPARVALGFGQTVNTGNYSSMRFDVRVEVPCVVEEIDAAFAYALGVVDSKCAELRAAIKEATGK